MTARKENVFLCTHKYKWTVTAQNLIKKIVLGEPNRQKPQNLASSSMSGNDV
jgi:hypothetical protein